MRLRRIAIAVHYRSGLAAGADQGPRGPSMPPPREVKTMTSPSRTSGPAAPWRCHAA